MTSPLPEGVPPGPVSIKVTLPAHLAMLGRCDRRIELEAVPTQRGVIDALEATYPGLRGMLREPGADRRRPYVRFFACELDLSHEDPAALLPDDVVAGRERYLVVGAMAGG